MAKQDDTMPCTSKGCKGTMTYHQKLSVRDDGTVEPSGKVGPRSDPDYAGWLCDADPRHFDFANP